ncbi:MAG TPA: ABC transporter ATP-binding protein [Acidimicrobiales bacterium]|nr:ABC transporter ATP-binding protein [Acidimicrobiales bacterium]
MRATNIRRLLAAIWADPRGRRWLVLSQLALLGQVVFDLLIPQAIRNLVNNGILAGDINSVVNGALWMAVFAVASAAFATAVAWYAAQVGEEAGHRLRSSVYRRVTQLSWGNIDRLETSDLLVRLTTDINQVRTVVTGSVTTLLRAPLMIVGAIVILLAIEPRLAVVMLVFLPVVIGVLAFYQRTGAPLYRAVLARFDGLNQVLQENMAGVRVVKAFVRRDYENDRFDHHNRDLQAAATKAQRAAALLNPALLLVVNLGLAGALWVGGDLVIDGTIELGSVFVLLNYLVAVMIPLVLLSVLLPQIASADSSVGRILEVLETQADITDRPDAPSLSEAAGGPVQGRVAFEGVSFAYLGPDGTPNPTPVLHDVDLVAEPGQIVAILGATGSGKSTLVNLIIRSYDVTAGRVTIDGVDVRDVTRESLLAAVTPVLQQPSLFSGTIEANLRFGAEAGGDGDRDGTTVDVVTAARAAEAATFVEDRPDGYNSEVKRRGANFSGGQRQRLSIARALVRRPRILILDDTTSALDVATEGRVQDAIRELMGDSTVFLVAQRISAVLTADVIVVLEEGRIVARGSHRELLHSSPEYRAIYESQLGAVPADA